MVINEKTYPIQTLWLIKNFIYIVIGTAVFSTFFYFADKSEEKDGSRPIGIIVFMIIIQIATFIVLVLRKMKFQYEFGEKNIILKQGVISKSERQAFYGRIQNISLSQDFIDKFIGIASLLIETASDSGGAKLVTEAKKNRGWNWFKLGFYSNSILIPGLLHENALDLKKFIMEQIKANPIDDAHSGL